MTYKFFKRWHRLIKLDWQVYHLYLLEQSPLDLRASEFGLEVIPLPDDYLIEFARYRSNNGLSQEEAIGLSISYYEKLKRFTHPLNQIMDIESAVICLLAQAAKGIPPEKVKRTGIRI